jgi:hypothetical protein
MPLTAIGQEEIICEIPGLTIKTLKRASSKQSRSTADSVPRLSKNSPEIYYHARRLTAARCSELEQVLVTRDCPFGLHSSGELFPNESKLCSFLALTQSATLSTFAR